LLSASLSRTTIQKKLAPLFRSFSINAIKKLPAEYKAHQESTTAAVQVELENYFHVSSNAKEEEKIEFSSVGDIFICHEFIQKCFANLFAENKENLEEAKRKLQVWWLAEGHAFFLENMAVSAAEAKDVAHYAGDLELAPLGRACGMNIHVVSRSRGIDTQITFANGKLPETFAEHIPELASREIIYRDGGDWIELTEDKLTSRLQAVPDFNAVSALLCGDHPPKRGDAVPVEWSLACVEQLKIRGIVSKRANVFSVGLAPAVARARVGEVPNAREIFDAWKATYHAAPNVILQNESAMHWNYARLLEVMVASPYVPAENERHANQAVSEIVDGLERKRSIISASEIKHYFESSFTRFFKGLQEHQAAGNGAEFFMNEKERRLKEIAGYRPSSKRLMKEEPQLPRKRFKISS
jgi:hypothetical protein